MEMAKALVKELAGFAKKLRPEGREQKAGGQ